MDKLLRSLTSEEQSPRDKKMAGEPIKTKPKKI